MLCTSFSKFSGGKRHFTVGELSDLNLVELFCLFFMCCVSSALKYASYVRYASVWISCMNLLSDVV